MKRFFNIFILAALTLLAACSKPAPAASPFVTVSPEGQLMLGDSVYRFVGTNFWYGPILASSGRGSNPERLARELDSLQAMGINNLRVLAGAEGPDSLPHHIAPQLLTAPGVYNDTLLVGLDRFIAELEKRDMKAVIYLTNSWEWSGGYGSYLQWTGHGVAPVPGIDGYQEYVDHAAKFVLDPKARQLALDHAKFMTSRVNTVTGKPYSESPAIMSWQIANEPRSFSKEGKEALVEWLFEMAKTIKEQDPNHLVSTGSEGSVGCELDLDLWTRIHSSPLIDYANIHLWPTNWGYASRDSVESHVGKAMDFCDGYINKHIEAMAPYKKPIVIEEFGYPRDGFKFGIDVPVTARDKFYAHIFERLQDSPAISGVNFWGWNGSGRPATEYWKPGNDYLCDPAHEPQGMYGVFDTDSTTIAIIRKAAKSVSK